MHTYFLFSGLWKHRDKEKISTSSHEALDHGTASSPALFCFWQPFLPFACFASRSVAIYLWITPRSLSTFYFHSLYLPRSSYVSREDQDWDPGWMVVMLVFLPTGPHCLYLYCLVSGFPNNHDAHWLSILLSCFHSFAYNSHSQLQYVLHECVL